MVASDNRLRDAGPRSDAQNINRLKCEWDTLNSFILKYAQLGI